MGNPPRPGEPGNPSARKILALLEHAILAPSSHNSQPWRFRLVGEDTIELRADRTRALPVTDPFDRELTISCGCALMNLMVAARHFGRFKGVEVLPRRLEPDLLARVKLAREPADAQSGSDLFEAIARRHTYRKRFAAKAVPAAVQKRLMAVAEAGGAWLECVTESKAKHVLAELVAEADRTLWADPGWRRELAMWMHPSRSRDGLVFPGLPAPLAHAVVRTFDMGDGQAAKDRDLADASPVLAVLGTARDLPKDWLAAGEALQGVLLTARQAGLQASFLNQPIQVPAHRPRLQSLLIHAGTPQVLLRLGFPSEEATPSSRRPIAEVLDSA
jgi:nitroreductase